ncbi:MAG: hypothetical protein CVV45_12805 [Spirochaetae bacterium HGW-Spirochaetae-10]|nr:MAG: hypothetical protein CVV45_12805 [Spirochaetae bacterium HGW-Spirochaetae-10]
MINLNPVPSLNGGKIIDIYETTFGDPLTLTGEGADSFRSFRFPDGTRIRAGCERIMTATRVPDRRGSIKEMSGYDDWRIDIEFDLVLPAYSDLLPNPETPGGLDAVADALGLQSILDALKKLHLIFQIESRVRVTNERLQALGIEYLVIRSLDIPDNPTYNHQPVKITALSDTDYELLLSSSEGGAA